MNNHERNIADRLMVPKSVVDADAAPRVPLALDTSKFHLGQREAMRSMRQLDQAVERKLNSVDQAGHVPGVNSILD